jgi:hypothetical protein
MCNGYDYVPATGGAYSQAAGAYRWFTDLWAAQPDLPGRLYEAYTLRMARWFVECQEDDGRWHNSPFLDPRPTDDSDMGITVEPVRHLSYILLALSEKSAAALVAAG